MDESILFAIRQLTGQPWLDTLMVTLSWLGDNGLVWCAMAVILLARSKTRYSGLICAVALLFSLLLCNLLIKNLVARPRPYDILAWLQPLVPLLSEFSFPSGHASSSFAAASAIALTSMNRKWHIPVYTLATLISFSRLYVGVHYPSDVLAGLFLGLFCGYLAWGIGRRFFPPTRAVINSKK
jgi:undecaprenyl-diphosphatase